MCRARCGMRVRGHGAGRPCAGKNNAAWREKWRRRRSGRGQHASVDGLLARASLPLPLPHVCLTLAISCEGRTTAPWCLITATPWRLAVTMLRLAPIRPSSASSRCSMAPSLPAPRLRSLGGEEVVGEASLPRDATPTTTRARRPGLPATPGVLTVQARNSPDLTADLIERRPPP